ncbi:Hypothetical protein A7982_05187 [Minicystis rosea]|nr:Hypothetical protein A7982_05187 [Minicystis rosea]
MAIMQAALVTREPFVKLLPGLRSERPTSDWFAYVLGVLPGVIFAVLYRIGLVSERACVLGFSLSFVGLNLAHMAATWSRVYLQKGGAAQAPVERIAIAGLLVLAALSLEATGHAAVLLGVQYYLSFHHALMQNYGLLRQTQRRSGRQLQGRRAWLDLSACLLAPFGVLLYRARAVSRSYNGAPLAVPPSWLVAALLAAGALSIVLWLARELRAARRGEPVELLGIVLILLTNAMWCWLLVAFEHPAVPMYALASGHYVQYLYFVWRFEARPAALTVLPGALRERVAPPRGIAYLVALGAFGAAVTIVLTLVAVVVRAAAAGAGMRPATALDIPPWAAAMIAINLHHYWLDHRVWRFAPKPAPAAQPAG